MNERKVELVRHIIKLGKDKVKVNDDNKELKEKEKEKEKKLYDLNLDIQVKEKEKELCNLGIELVKKELVLHEAKTSQSDPALIDRHQDDVENAKKEIKSYIEH